MAYVKRILCLANSRKTSGRCVVGKEVLDPGWGAWIRPVSTRPTEELSEEERRYENGEDPKIAEVIEVPFLEPQPHTYQRENHLIDDSKHWTRIGRCSWAELLTATDTVAGSLWPNGFSSSRGTNDRVPEEQATALDRSLYLIGPLPIEITVEPGWGKRDVRGKFEVLDVPYRLKVTDPLVERAYLQRANGTYKVAQVTVVRQP